jgi:hypothetical protein
MLDPLDLLYLDLQRNWASLFQEAGVEVAKEEVLCPVHPETPSAQDFKQLQPSWTLFGGFRDPKR